MKVKSERIAPNDDRPVLQIALEVSHSEAVALKRLTGDVTPRRLADGFGVALGTHDQKIIEAINDGIFGAAQAYVESINGI